MKKSARSMRPYYELKLRHKVGIVFFLPALLALLVMLAAHIVRDAREAKANREQVKVAASSLGHAMLNGLRHAMLKNDSETLDSMVNDMGSAYPVRRIWIVDWQNVVWKSSAAGDVGRMAAPADLGCPECHQNRAGPPPQAIAFSANSNLLRVAIPVEQAPECRECHPAAQPHMGVMILDASAPSLQAGFAAGTLLEGLALLMILAAFLLLDFELVQWLIVRRVEVIHNALLKFGGGDLSTRITPRWRTSDELTQLADQFNEIAENFERLQAKRKEKERVRAQAIIEERERIARELHDGVAQFLGYLSAKLGSVQIALKNQRMEAADKSLAQIEASVRDQSAEVRSAIVGLKMSGGIDRGLISSVREFVEQCNRIDDLALELEIVGEAESAPLSEESALQLFRILQEAVSNVRKHARAAEASIRFQRQDDRLTMTIRDNGVGFDPLLTGLERRGRFGLQIMVERAHAIGARIEIKSAPGQGAQVIVDLALQES